MPVPGPGEVRIKVLAAGTGFTDTFIRRGRYPDFKGPLPFIPGYDLVGVVEETGPGVVKLTVVHDGFLPGSAVLQGVSSGWPAVLASLKTLLETGSPLPSA